MTCSHKCAVKDDTLIVDKYSFVAFIGKVVNVTSQQTKKSSWLKTIVETAGEYLGEMLHDMLAPNDGFSQLSD